MSRERINELVELAADGLADDAQLDELQALLADDPEAELAAAELLLFEGELRGLHRPDLADRVVDAVEGERRDRVQAGVMDQITASDSRRWSKTRSGRLQAPHLPETDRQRRSTRRRRRGTGRHARRSPPSSALERKPGSGRLRARSATGRHRRPQRSSPVWIYAMAAGLLLVVGLGIHLAMREKPVPPREEVAVAPPAPQPAPTIPTVALETDRSLTMVSGGAIGRVASLPVGRNEVPIGDTLIIDATTNLRYDDGSVITLRPGARLRLADHAAGPRLELVTGSLSATVKQQPTGQDFRVTTGGMEVRVIGTRFSVVAGAAERSVAVEEGRVACRAHGREVELGPFQRAASDGSTLRVSGHELELFLIDVAANRVCWERGPLRDGDTVDLAGLTTINFVVLAPPRYEAMRITRSRVDKGGGTITEEFVPFCVYGDKPEVEYHAHEPTPGPLTIAAETPDGTMQATWRLTLK